LIKIKICIFQYHFVLCLCHVYLYSKAELPKVKNGQITDHSYFSLFPIIFLLFCTEGCNNCGCKANKPAPSFDNIDFDDDNDASKILFAVLGPPLNNVMYIRWEHEIEKNTCLVKLHHSRSEINPCGSESSKEEDLSLHKESSLVIQ
jgi:hypothetical protein